MINTLIYRKLSLVFLPGAFCLLTVLALRCQTIEQPIISGTVVMQQGWKPVLYLVQPRNFSEIAANYSGVVIDSAEITSDGSFAFSHFKAPEQPALFQICIQQTGTRFSNKLLDEEPDQSNYCPLVLQEGETVRFKTVADHFQASLTFENASPENVALLHLRDIRIEAFRKRTQMEQDIDKNEESAILEQEAALLQFQGPLMAFADSTSFLLPALLAIRWVSPDGDYERIPEFLSRQCQHWGALAASNLFAAQLCQKADRNELPVQVGDLMPDFQLPMMEGDTIGLRSLLGSRLTVLDLWASWCGPCRKENREVLAPLWNRYKDQGLQIVGYSIDSGRGAWRAAIEKDGAGWKHASHLNGDKSPFLERLRLTTIPANFLLDADGKVVAKNLHGEALKVFVEAYLYEKQ